MYIPRSTLLLIIFSYLLYLITPDWVMQIDGAWYRPFLIGLAIIGAAAWIYREQNTDDL